MYLIIGFCVIFQAAIGEEAICHPKGKKKVFSVQMCYGYWIIYYE